MFLTNTNQYLFLSKGSKIKLTCSVWLAWHSFTKQPAPVNTSDFLGISPNKASYGVCFLPLLLFLHRSQPPSMECPVLHHWSWQHWMIRGNWSVSCSSLRFVAVDCFVTLPLEWRNLSLAADTSTPATFNWAWQDACSSWEEMMHDVEFRRTRGDDIYWKEHLNDKIWLKK